MATLSGPFTYHKHLNRLRDLLNGEHSWSRFFAPILLVMDALLCSLIISLVSYTEIDWRAYMEQVEQVIEGERDYTLINGCTGPLVYPAAHVYLYWILYHVTDQGNNILRAQRLFGVLYLATITVVISCYRRAQAPIYILPMLILSKRLHSIFMLRLFNDCFAVFFFWVAIYLFQRRFQTLGSLAYSFGLGIKMSLLLSIPAIGVLLFLTGGFSAGLKQAGLILQLQMILALPFISSNLTGYLSKAFELSRQFKFRWTVNWRFVGEKTFSSQRFSIILLMGHVCTLILFLTTRWLRPARKSLTNLLKDILNFQGPFGKFRNEVSSTVHSDFILTTILSANAIGLLFARSLHYQFYAYIALGSPFLLWRAGLHPLLQYLLWGLQEWAWNVYPSTISSSIVVVGAQLFIVGSIWWGTRKDFRNTLDKVIIKKYF